METLYKQFLNKPDVLSTHQIAKAMRDLEKRKAMMQAERDEQIAEANKRAAEAQARIDAAKRTK